MRKPTKSPGEKIVKDIKRATRKQNSSEEKFRILLDGLLGDLRAFSRQDCCIKFGDWRGSVF